MIERILPPGVCAAETFAELDEPLFPDEEASVARAVAKRRNEFRSVRGCARTALAGLGLDRPSLVPGVRGAPSWPPGVVGAMTHCDGYRAAAVAWTHQLTGLGIDGEPHAPLPEGVLGAVTLPEERDHLRALAGTAPGVCWDRLLFSAKESVYKTWFPQTRTWLGFEEARLTIDPVGGALTVDLLATGLVLDGRPVTTLTGRWVVDRGLVVTVVTLPRAGGVAPLRAHGEE